ncbi:hypothetical protein [Sediminispirochaeta smaragdinae]|uniref:Uncharacterized protein n=1 Tax=Sediminispirochaeta smaragdinae (strain DSM 11293 / JCM 15392 / SEBR 4228) TaxID=573413 RepID=E1R3G1_SEDSS|nr:hypothetical protein [Sediminispirochaeta smaragdinae]ADK81592.1 hypothetical protein Spirs_2479 [Sediminispirochaeta smaragdinae DSM 11293]
MSGKTSIYWNSVLEKKLDPLVKRHGGASRAITIVADRYEELMKREKRTLRELFSDGEVNLMLNNALSTAYEPGAVIPGAVLADTEDEIDAQFEYFGVNRGDIIKKLRSLNIGQQFALVDYLEELRGDAGGDDSTEEDH